ncbi:hypothetical protein PMZ80_003786 [Knufia obscura]|uniref:Uncharacterized protein n=2 Tax=Knufia TaxID=430999 RepID=A0AAN8ICD2_9EURO|nr:hypothetical protein PMZ80_003786 [Knufia obscura]KAK5958296.1 hypothetical protein OHC33_000138 [Knufia fluminis]
MSSAAPSSLNSTTSSPLPSIPKLPLIRTVPHLQAAPQNQSPLFRLPAELRLMVLRELLVSNELIGERQEYVDPNWKYPANSRPRNTKGQFLKVKTVHGHRLTPAILVTCQTMLRDGWQLFYENTITIQIYSGREVLQGHSSGKYSCDECLVLPMWDGQCMLHNTIRPNVAPTRLASRFQKFHIELNVDPNTDHYDYESYRDMVQKLLPTLSGACVRVKPIGICAEDHNFASLEQQLKVFQLLRCQKFSIEATPYVDKTTIATIEHIVMSNEAVVDLWRLLSKLVSHRILVYKMEMSDSELVTLDQLFDDMQTAAIEFDSERFYKLRAKFFNRFDRIIADMKEAACDDRQ